MIAMNLTPSQKVLLKTIAEHDGQWNWYQLGRVCLSKLDSPADFELKTLREAGYLEERHLEGENLDRLHITEIGRRGLAALDTA